MDACVEIMAAITFMFTEVLFAVVIHPHKHRNGRGAKLHKEARRQTRKSTERTYIRVMK
jgi:hypothetical protein